MIFGCKDEPKPTMALANDIVTKAITVSGGKSFDQSEIAFNFRDHYYSARRYKGNFSLIRRTVEESDTIVDELTNSGFKRYSNAIELKISDSLAKVYTASVNSVHYFSVLPYGLNDKAVHKTLLGQEQLKGQTYYKIKITFSKDGGGEDYEDVFVYWINKQDFKVEYLAYSYNEDDGVGMRFREAYNERFVNGLRFVDYNNYKSDDLSMNVADLGQAFESNLLKLVSKIELNTIEVDLIDD